MNGKSVILLVLFGIDIYLAGTSADSTMSAILAFNSVVFMVLALNEWKEIKEKCNVCGTKLEPSGNCPHCTLQKNYELLATKLCDYKDVIWLFVDERACTPECTSENGCGSESCFSNLLSRVSEKKRG